jgi:uncharacterized RDD family membrane protein YckC
VATVGIYYRHDAYASFWLRLLVDLIDALTAGVLCCVAILALSAFVPPRLILFVCAAIWFCYFVLLKRSRGGTVGYRLCGVRIVALDGQRAGLIPLTIRMLFMLFGPFNYLLDLVWMANEPQRQAFRDKLADTYVVKKNAVPAGSGMLNYRVYFVMGYSFLFREVQIETSASQTESF